MNNWIKVEKFQHMKGAHCDSTSQKNYFNFLGIPITEAMAFGLDASMGFSFWEDNDNPERFFVGGKQNTVTDKSLACRLLGLTIEKQTFQRADDAWERSKTYLDRGIPLMIQADIVYLPYMFTKEDRKYGVVDEEMHFGGHTLNLIGYNSVEQLALISDNTQPKEITIPISQLKKTRNSQEGWKEMWPHNCQFIIKPRPDGKKPPFAAGAKLAIQESVKNMLGPSTNNLGIGGIRKLSKSIPNLKEMFGAQKNPELGIFMVYGYIQEFGTGGGLFRHLFGDFLKELQQNKDVKQGIRAWSSAELHDLGIAQEKITQSGFLWGNFAEHLKSTLDEFKTEAYHHLDLGYLLNLTDKILQVEELTFRTLSKIKL